VPSNSCGGKNLNLSGDPPRLSFDVGKLRKSALQRLFDDSA